MLSGAVSRPLPPYRGILAVDFVKFTGNRDRYLPMLSTMIPKVLEKAFIRCGQEHVWQEKRFPELSGDAYVFGVVPEYLPFLIDPFLDSLQDTLREEYAPSLRAADRALTMRLRIAIHVGPIPDGSEWRQERTGKTTNDAFRLLNSDRLREEMTCTDPEVTLVGAIVSDRVFQDVVAGGYTAVHESQFRRVTAEVPGKGFQQEAWIYIPRQSFTDRTLDRSDRALDRLPSGHDGQTPPGSSSVFHGQVGQAFTGGTYHGNFTFGEK